MFSQTYMTESGSVSLDVLVRLRTAILDGRYAPEQKLPFAELQDEFHAGIGTIREALSHLVSEGLLTMDAGKGFRVAPVSLKDLGDISENRVEIEKRAIRLALEKGDDKWEVSILSAHHLLEKLEQIPLAQRLADPTAWTNIHRDFHHALLSACNSKWLLHFHRVLFDQAHRYRMLALRHRPRGQPARSGEHRAIMEAVLARDLKLSTALSVQHILLTVEDVKKYAPQISAEAKAPPPSKRKQKS